MPVTMVRSIPPSQRLLLTMSGRAIEPSSRTNAAVFYALLGPSSYRCPHCSASTPLDPRELLVRLWERRLPRHPPELATRFDAQTPAAQGECYDFRCRGCDLPARLVISDGQQASATALPRLDVSAVLELYTAPA